MRATLYKHIKTDLSQERHLAAYISVIFTWSIMRNLILLVCLLAIGKPGFTNEATSTEMSDELRAMVLNLNPKDVGITKDNFPYSVFAIVMEVGVAKGSYTLSSIADGSTSLYFSTGGGIIGGGEHKNVYEASMHLLSGAEHFHHLAKSVTSFPKPTEGNVIFYFITFDGVKSYQVKEEDLGNRNDDLSGLFFAAHNVIGALRNIEEQ